MKVSGKLIIGFSVALIVAVVMGIIGITGMGAMRESEVFMYEKRVRGIEFVHEAQNNFDEMRVQGRNTIINSFYDDKKGATDSNEAFEFHAGEFLKSLEKSREIADTEEMLGFYDRIQEIFLGSYLPTARTIHETCINDIPDHHNRLYINVLVATATTAAVQIESLLTGLLELNSTLARQSGIDNTWLTRQYAIVLFSIMLAAVCIVSAVAYLIVRSVAVPIEESAGVLMEIAQGNFEARVKGDYKDEFKTIKDSINYTARQLTDYLEEKVSVERAGRELLAAANRAATILLMTGSDEDSEDSLMKGIEAIGNFMEADCIELWKSEITDESRMAIKWQYWYSELGNKLKTNVATDFSYDDHPSFYETLSRNEIVGGPVHDLSQEYQELFGRFGIKSALNIPLFIADEFWGFFCVLDFHSYRNFTVEEVEILRTTFLMIVNAVNRRRQDMEIARQRLFEEQNYLKQVLIDSIPHPVFYKDAESRFLGFNKAYSEVFGVDTQELIGKTALEMEHLSMEDRAIFQTEAVKVIEEGGYESYEVPMKFHDGIIHETLYSVAGFRNADGSPGGLIGIFIDIAGLRQAERALTASMEKVEAQNKTINESIAYAGKIQRNLLPPDDLMAAAFSDFSVIWKPRDVVGGDIYWVKQFEKGTVLCVCDCTGHGMPGALLTMLVISALDGSVWPGNCDDTAGILWRLDQKLSAVLHHAETGAGTRHGITDISDGCDIAAVFIANDGRVKFSSGKIPVFVCDGNEVTMHKGQKIFVGEGMLKSKDEVNTVCMAANPANSFYIATDGLFDQIGGIYGWKYGYKYFKQIILDNHNEKQAVITGKLWENFEQYRGGQARRDDLALVAFKV